MNLRTTLLKIGRNKKIDTKTCLLTQANKRLQTPNSYFCLKTKESQLVEAVTKFGYLIVLDSLFFSYHI